MCLTYDKRVHIKKTEDVEVYMLDNSHNKHDFCLRWKVEVPESEDIHTCFHRLEQDHELGNESPPLKL